MPSGPRLTRAEKRMLSQYERHQTPFLHGLTNEGVPRDPNKYNHLKERCDAIDLRETQAYLERRGFLGPRVDRPRSLPAISHGLDLTNADVKIDKQARRITRYWPDNRELRRNPIKHHIELFTKGARQRRDEMLEELESKKDFAEFDAVIRGLAGKDPRLKALVTDLLESTKWEYGHAVGRLLRAARAVVNAMESPHYTARQKKVLSHVLPVIEDNLFQNIHSLHGDNNPIKGFSRDIVDDYGREVKHRIYGEANYLTNILRTTEVLTETKRATMKRRGDSLKKNQRERRMVEAFIRARRDYPSTQAPYLEWRGSYPFDKDGNTEFHRYRWIAPNKQTGKPTVHVIEVVVTGNNCKTVKKEKYPAQPWMIRDYNESAKQPKPRYE